MQQSVQTDAKCNIQQCWEFLANNVVSVCKRLQTTPHELTNFHILEFNLN